MQLSLMCSSCTGRPLTRLSAKHGYRNHILYQSMFVITCSSCAKTMILVFLFISRHKPCGFRCRKVIGESADKHDNHKTTMETRLEYIEGLLLGLHHTFCRPANILLLTVLSVYAYLNGYVFWYVCNYLLLILNYTTTTKRKQTRNIKKQYIYMYIYILVYICIYIYIHMYIYRAEERYRLVGWMGGDRRCLSDSIFHKLTLSEISYKYK